MFTSTTTTLGGRTDAIHSDNAVHAAQQTVSNRSRRCHLERIPQELMPLILQYLRVREVFDSVLTLNRWFRVLVEMNTTSLCFHEKNRCDDTTPQLLRSILPRFVSRHKVDQRLQKIVIRRHNGLPKDALQIISEMLPTQITVCMRSLPTNSCSTILMMNNVYVMVAITVAVRGFDDNAKGSAYMAIVADTLFEEMRLFNRCINLEILCVPTNCGNYPLRVVVRYIISFGFVVFLTTSTRPQWVPFIVEYISTGIMCVTTNSETQWLPLIVGCFSAVVMCRTTNTGPQWMLFIVGYISFDIVCVTPNIGPHGLSLIIAG